MKLLTPNSTRRGSGHALAAGQRVAAFTMLELALCLGIIGVGLVAIIGVLPTGMQVQRDNREDTVIYQDAGFLMAAIRGGTNENMDATLATNLSWIRVRKNGALYGFFTNGQISGNDIIGILSLPKPIYEVEAKFWASTGPVAGSAPVNRDFSFGYLLTPEVVPYSAPPIAAAPFMDPVYAEKLTNSLYEVRLKLSWPVLANGNPGPGRRTFRTMVSGTLASNVDLAFPDYHYFFQNAYLP